MMPSARLAFYPQYLNLPKVFKAFGHSVVMHVQRLGELPCADIYPPIGVYFGDRVE